MLQALQKDRKLGVSQIKGRYDLPLTQNAGATFLMILVGLMTFLALITLSAGFTLNEVTNRWSSGLENALTIEIPAGTESDEIRTKEQISALSAKVEDVLKQSNAITSYEIKTDADISALLAPWLGEDLNMDTVPLPGLISVTLNEESDAAALSTLERAVHAIASDIKLDTHEEWLGDILRMALSLKIAALFITLVIGFTTITAIAGGVRSRMAEHQDDISLLHLIGARDIYIMKQFQRHASILTLKGSFFGMLAGFAVLGFIAFLAHNSEQALVPDMSLSGPQLLTLLCLPICLCLIGAVTARITVLRVLSAMP